MDILAIEIGYLWSEIGYLWSQYVWPILMFVIGLGLVVFVHELGHFLAAKWSGVKVEEFALGFGKKILGFRRGETLYRINVLPLGGYVKMLGQDDFRPMATAEADSRSWQRLPAGKRLIILSAGVAMNVVFSVMVFVIVYMIGIRFIAPVVGGTQAGFPAATVRLPDEVAEATSAEQAVGLRPGDRIVAIDGKSVRRFNQVQMAAILSDEGEVFTLTVAREVTGREIVFDVTLKPKKVTEGELFRRFGTNYAFGINRPASTIIVEPGVEGFAASERFQKSDRIVGLDGQPVRHYWDLQPALRANAGRAVEFVVERGGRRVPVKLTPFNLYGDTNKDSKELLGILGMSPRVRVAVVDKDSPAEKAGLETGDIIADYAGRGPPSLAELLKVNEEFANKETSIRVIRDGRTIKLKITPKKKKDEQVLIGIAPAPEQDTPLVARVREGSPAAVAGLVEGATLTMVNEKPVATWPQVYAALRESAGKKTTLTYTFAGEERSADPGVLTKGKFDPDKYFFSTSAIHDVMPLKTDVIRGNPAQALAWSAEDTCMWMVSVYKSLRNIFKRRASTKGLSGPVGIGAIAVIKGREGVIELAYFMAMLSALVAVFNFLPLPVVDGGLVVLVLIEKIRGRPLPLKVFAAIQTTGLLLIICLFIALTYRDILRFLFDKW